MGYSTSANPDRYRPIEPLLQKLATLETSATLRVDQLSPEGLERARWLLYNWLKEQGLSHHFLIRRKAYSLEITRRKKERPRVRIEEQIEAPVEKALDALLLLSSEDAVDAEVTLLLEQGKLTTTQAVEAKVKWKEIME